MPGLVPGSVLSSVTVGWISEALLVDLGLNWGPQSQMQKEGNHKTTRQEGESTLGVEGRRERETEGMQASSQNELFNQNPMLRKIANKTKVHNLLLLKLMLWNHLREDLNMFRMLKEICEEITLKKKKKSKTL